MPEQEKREEVERLTKKTVEQLDTERENENLKKIEATLFIAGRFLSLKELVILTDINPILLRQLLEKISEKYSEENSGLIIIKKSEQIKDWENELWKMDVKPDYLWLVNKLATGTSEFGKAEQETLAVIAYKQPIKQSVVVKIRGNKAYEHIKKFTSAGLLRAKKAGRTQELSLKQEFYDYFHLRENSKS